MTTDARPTVWVLGDQLSATVGALRSMNPADCRVLMVESTQMLRSRRWHRQRAHVVLSAMRHFAAQLTEAGFEVDYRRSASLAAGLREHRAAFDPRRVLATQPSSHRTTARLAELGVELLRNRFFLATPDEFGAWAEGRASLRLEDFYRWQRRRLDVLMDGDEPTGGIWNHDHDNREPPPTDGRAWPPITMFDLDEIDREVLADLDDAGVDLWGEPPSGLWPVTRDQALLRLDQFVVHALPVFGAHEDAVLQSEWKMAHSVLSSALNLGLLHPSEVIVAAEAQFRSHDLPINSVEGFVRQVIGWREYVWGVYWLWGDDYRLGNALAADRPVPPAFTGEAPTEMACVGHTIDGLRERAYAHHIERLMVLSNLALIAGVDPRAMTDWMRANFVDAADWVMVPNVVGMGLHADGGRMATKPYASGGAYLNRMTDHCSGCAFDPKKRTGETACPFTTLYWDFLARNENRLRDNHRMRVPLSGLQRLSDLDETRERAVEVRRRLDAGTL